MKQYEHILLTVEDNIATITLNHPEIRNAFVPPYSYIEISDALETCGADPAVGAVVFTGAGKHFCAGGNISTFKESIEARTYILPENVRLIGKATQDIRKCPKPVIAMVNGAAAGAGCSIALACDFRVLTPRSKLIMAYINLGLPGDANAMYYCMLHLGLAKTTELLMTGEPLDAAQAERLGLVTILAEEETLRERSYELAGRMAAKPRGAVKYQKELLYKYYMRDIQAFTEDEAAGMAACSRSEDFAEAVSAFLEKRKPQFKGC